MSFLFLSKEPHRNFYQLLTQVQKARGLSSQAAMPNHISKTAFADDTATPHFIPPQEIQVFYQHLGGKGGSTAL